MILAVDIGNSNIVIALNNEGKWTHTFRYETKETQSEFYYEQALRNLLLEWGIHHSEVNNCVISSVVPDLNNAIKEAFFQVTGHKAMVLNPELFKNLDMFIPHRYEIGSDIVSNAYAAIHLFSEKCIIIDFGTALTFTIVSKIEGIKGVTIAPGLHTAVQSLSNHTAQLPVVPLELPDSVIGHDTTSAIQAGVTYGYVGLVSHILTQIKAEINDTGYKVIATGGLSSILKPLEIKFDFVHKLLTLDGMKLLYEYAVKNTK